MNKLKFYRKILLAIVIFLGVFVSSNYPRLGEEVKAASNSLEREAKEFYQNKQYLQAIDRLEAAIQEYKNDRDLGGEINARRNLALVHDKIGNWQQGKIALATNLKQINEIENKEIKQRLRAESLEVLGEIQLSIGETKAALNSWQETTKIYRELKDNNKINKSKMNLAIAQSSLGLYNQARNNLLAIREDLADEEIGVKIETLLELGDIFRKVGNLSEAESILSESLRLARTIDNKEALGQILISLGDLERVKRNENIALRYYQEAIDISPDPEVIVRAKLNQLSWYNDNGIWDENLTADIQNRIARLPVSRTKIYSRINLANNTIKYLEKNPDRTQQNRQIYQILTTAIAEAKEIQDKRAQSYANGTLGYLYEQNQRYDEAKTLTEKALLVSIDLKSPDLSYQWQWQLGRILEKQGQTESAIASYSQSVNNLQLLRGDLVAISDEIKFNFQDSVEPVYRELADLLLKESNPSQTNLKKARTVIEALQLATLNNFFREACLDTTPQQIDRLDREASVIYSIILPDRLALILSVPGEDLTYKASFFANSQAGNIEEILDELYREIGPSLVLGEDLGPYEKLYDLLIRPLESNLRNSNIKTLVFILDGSLRRVPVAALFDGEKYLVEKYNLVLTPGLQLLKSPSLSPERLQTIFAGISEARDGFLALPGVKREAQKISETIPTDILLNQDFTSDRLQNEIARKAFPIVHLATHGQFSSSAEDTFLLAWDTRINVKALDRLLGARDRQRQSPIELLILSACETAEGDRRAALGIAGVAVRSGARSTIATLWAVQDDSTVLIIDKLYEELSKPGVNKAEALRNAQLSLIKDPYFSRPYYWSGFVLIGNWL